MFSFVLQLSFKLQNLRCLNICVLWFTVFLTIFIRVSVAGLPTVAVSRSAARWWREMESKLKPLGSLGILCD